VGGSNTNLRIAIGLAEEREGGLLFWVAAHQDFFEETHLMFLVG
jgi:hypothetical protein